jgi:type IV pilus assembly protein PilF
VKRTTLPAVLLTVLLAACNAPGPRQQQAPEPTPDPLPKPASPQARAKARTDLAFSYYSEARFKIAIDEARKALEADPTYAPAHHLLALVHVYLKEYSTAQMHFEQAARLAPKDSAINNAFGLFLCTQGRGKEGIDRLMLAARDPLYDTPSYPYTNAGMCSMWMNDDKAAEEYLRRAVIADGQNTQAVYLLALVSYQQKKLDEAKRLVDEVIGRGETNAESIWLALRVERKLGNREAEAGYASQLRRKFKDSPQYKSLVQGNFE